MRTTAVDHQTNTTSPAQISEAIETFVYSDDTLRKLTQQFNLVDYDEEQDSEEEDDASSRAPPPSAEGKLYAAKTLDYENETHRRGFRFLVQVTDKVSVLL